MRCQNVEKEILCRDLNGATCEFFSLFFRGRSVRAAAKLLGVSHSTVSRRLQAMETRLGAKLFDRQPEGFVITPVGEAVVGRAERVESEVHGLELDILGRDARLAGPVRISMPPPLAHHMMMPHIAEFAALYPDIQIEIVSTYENSRPGAAQRRYCDPIPTRAGGLSRRAPTAGIYELRLWVTRICRGP